MKEPNLAVETPHHSHDLSEWVNTVVGASVAGTARIGQLRTCRRCDGEQTVTSSGSETDDKLRRPCVT